MELQSQHSPGGSLVVLQQPSRERRPRLEYERAAVLSLDQIRAIRSSNEYTEGPSVAPRKPPPCPVPRSEKQERTHEVILVNNNYERRPPAPPALIRSTSTSSGASSGGCSSASSEQGLLGRSPPPAGPALARRPERIIQSQPKSKPSALSEEKALKPVWKEDSLEEHRFICERCGRCKCRECTAPRTLPSCLACQGHCLCSPESAVEHGTCMCLVRGVFYHCSNDDEGDSCADSPCSFSRPHCCSRFLCMGLMSVFFPCVLCYPLARGCVKACQGCYDRASRPGCRCKNSNTVYCKLENWSPEAFKKPS